MPQYAIQNHPSSDHLINASSHVDILVARAGGSITETQRVEIADDLKDLMWNVTLIAARTGHDVLHAAGPILDWASTYLSDARFKLLAEHGDYSGPIPEGYDAFRDSLRLAYRNAGRLEAPRQEKQLHLAVHLYQILERAATAAQLVTRQHPDLTWRRITAVTAAAAVAITAAIATTGIPITHILNNAINATEATDGEP